LKEGAELGLPVSPFLDMSDLVIKDRNEEGGMGIHFFKNATAGGEWVIQRRLHNADLVKSLLPANTPLSTFRVMTASTQFLGKPFVEFDQSSRGSTHHDTPTKPEDYVEALSCVFRAGRAGADTDHSSILFDVDVERGILKRGTTNDHWYNLGPRKAMACPWLSGHDSTHMEDVPVTGRELPLEKLLDVCLETHAKLLPDVPIAGWDVALCAEPDEGTFLLEANLSCNFFRGSFDEDLYFSFMDAYLRKLNPLREKFERDIKE
jgi:hypothetical protein